MTTKIDWKSGVSGNFATGANWAGGVVPGATSDVLIAAASSTFYTVTLSTDVAVAALTLSHADAVLDVTGTLSGHSVTVASGILLDSGLVNAGTLALNGGSLFLTGGTVEGVVKQGKGHFAFGLAGGTLRNVTWEGLLAPKFATNSTLTVTGGLTLTGAGGIGPGSADFSGPVELVNVAALDDATIQSTYLGFSGAPTVTLGAGLSLTAGDLLSSGTLIIDGSLAQNGQAEMLNIGAATVVNNATISGATIETHGEQFTNNGTVAATNFYSFNGVFTNNGLIECGPGGVCAVNVGSFTAGAGSAIVLDGGNLGVESADLTLTTAQLYGIYAADHVTGTGAYGFEVGGGETVLDNAGATLTIGAGSLLGTLSDFTNFTISGGTVVDQQGALATDVTLQNLTLDAPGTVETFNSFTGLLDDVTLSGASSLAVGGVLQLTGTLAGVDGLTVSAAASGVWSGVAGDLDLDDVSFTGVGGSDAVSLSCLGTLATITLGTNQAMNDASINLGSGTLALGINVSWRNSSINVSGSAVIENLNDAESIGAGVSINVASGGSLDLLAAVVGIDFRVLMTTGTITSAGTLMLDPGESGSGFVNTGDIEISAGGTLVGGFSLTGGQATALTNDGRIALDGASSVAALNFDISGTGSIVLDGTGNAVAVGGTVAAGQVVSFQGTQETLGFISPTAATGFAGSIAGFAAGDTLIFEGETLTSATFSGASIVVTLSTGGTLALATAGDLTGALTVSNSNGIGTLTFGTAAATVHDWNVPAFTSGAPEHPAVANVAARDVDAFAGLRLDMMAHHGFI